MLWATYYFMHSTDSHFPPMCALRTLRERQHDVVPNSDSALSKMRAAITFNASVESRLGEGAVEKCCPGAFCSMVAQRVMVASFRSSNANTLEAL